MRNQSRATGLPDNRKPDSRRIAKDAQCQRAQHQSHRENLRKKCFGEWPEANHAAVSSCGSVPISGKSASSLVPRFNS